MTSNESSQIELAFRVKALEERLQAQTSRADALDAKVQKYETRFQYAIVVSIALAAVGITGGAILKSIQGRLDTAAEQTKAMEKELSQWDNNLKKNLSRLDSAGKAAAVELQSDIIRLEKESQDRLQQAATVVTAQIDALAQKKFLPMLQNGAATLKVRRLEIMGKGGTVLASLGAGTSETGTVSELRLNDAEGKTRNFHYVSGAHPYSKYFNSEDKLVLFQGVFSDSDSGFVDLRSVDSDKLLARIGIEVETKAGFARLYNPQGKQLVYLGADSNSGDGLLNLSGKDGTPTKSYTSR